MLDLWVSTAVKLLNTVVKLENIAETLDCTEERTVNIVVRKEST